MFPKTVLLLIPLILLIPLLTSFVKHKVWRITLISLLTAFIVMELVSVYFSGGFIDYQFYVNLNLHDMLAGLMIFKFQALLMVISFIAIVILLIWLSHWVYTHCYTTIRCLLIVLCFIFVGRENGPLAKVHQIYQVTTASQQDFHNALDKLGMNDYLDKSMLEAIKGKNIVVISLESFEQGFLSFPEITPNLNQLSQQYTYFDKMPMALGSSWTTASMYTYMTGVPFLIGSLETQPLLQAKELQWTSIADVLHTAGYQTKYIMGNPSFAGMGNIIELFDISIVSEDTYPNRYPPAPFGLYDRDVFDLAKSETLLLSEQQQPFALFISTVSTHAPDGFADLRMTKNLPHLSPQDGMLFVAASLDYNLGQYIAFLNEQKLLDNTVFFIFPDHQMMGAGTKIIQDLSQKPRQLYLITNADKDDISFKTLEPLYQLDLPRLILDGAKVQSNAKFLSDVIRAEDKLTFIETNKVEIAAANKASMIYAQ